MQLKSYSEIRHFLYYFLFTYFSIPTTFVHEPENPLDRYKNSTYKGYLFGNSIEKIAKAIRTDLDLKKFASFLNTPSSEYNRKLFVKAFRPYISDIDENNCIRGLTTVFRSIIYKAAGLPETECTSTPELLDEIGQIPLGFDEPPSFYSNTLLLEANYHCQFIGCRKALYVEKDGKKHDVYKAVVIDEDVPCDDFNNLIVMCPECAELYRLDHTPAEMDIMKERKRKLVRAFNANKFLSEQKIEEGVENLLRQVDQIDYEKLNKQTTNPVAIREKIEKKNSSLFATVNNFAVTYFNDIEAVQKRLVKEGAFSFDSFKAHIHAMYETQKSKGLSQPEIFNTISQWLADSTGASFEISEAVIAYFVQICEVFDVISE